MKAKLLPCLIALSVVACGNTDQASSFRDCQECPEMLRLPAGEFIMGSSESETDRGQDEGPQHKVNIAYELAVGKYEITFAEWDACVSGGGCNYIPGDEGWGRGRRPVINVSWNDAQDYVKWLQMKTGKPYRLLSEAEWEYAARAKTGMPFMTGDCITMEWANFDGHSERYRCAANAGVFQGKTTEVGSYKPNLFGLHDMHGNVWEWVEDCHGDNYANAPNDGKVSPHQGECLARVHRGGAWDDYPYYLRSAYRGSDNPARRNNNYGFRVARLLE